MTTKFSAMSVSLPSSRRPANWPMLSCSTPPDSSLASVGTRVERDVEVDQRDVGRDVEFLVDREQEQVDLQEREQLGEDLAVHVEHGERREQLRRAVGVHRLVEEVLGQLLQPDLAVLVRVVQVEVDLGEDAAGDARPGDAEVELGRRRDAAGQRHFGHVVAAAVRGARVADEQAVEQQSPGCGSRCRRIPSAPACRSRTARSRSARRASR